MQIVAVVRARVAVLTPLEEMNPHGLLIFPDLTGDLVARYHFLKFPQTWDDYNPREGGIQYLQGQWKGHTINLLEIFQGGFTVETSSSTEDSEAFLSEMLTWIAPEYGLVFRSDMLTKKFFVSHLTFTSEVPLLEIIHPAFTEFGNRITQSLPSIFRSNLSLRVNSLHFSTDPTDDRRAVSLQIERRAGSSFSDNKFFSTAPLSTKEHINFLADFETAIIESQKAR